MLRRQVELDERHVEIIHRCREQGECRNRKRCALEALRACAQCLFGMRQAEAVGTEILRCALAGIADTPRQAAGHHALRADGVFEVELAMAEERVGAGLADILRRVQQERFQLHAVKQRKFLPHQSGRTGNTRRGKRRAGPIALRQHIIMRHHKVIGHFTG